MGYSVRTVALTASGEARRLPGKWLADVLDDPSSHLFPHLAGERLRAGEGIVELERREPVEIVRLVFFYLPFDSHGVLLTEGFLAQASASMDRVFARVLPPGPEEKVIPAAARFLAQGIRWQPTPAEEFVIREAVLRAG
jgi:hypothetical protein